MAPTYPILIQDKFTADINLEIMEYEKEYILVIPFSFLQHPWRTDMGVILSYYHYYSRLSLAITLAFQQMLRIPARWLFKFYSAGCLLIQNKTS